MTREIKDFKFLRTRKPDLKKKKAKKINDYDQVNQLYVQSWAKLFERIDELLTVQKLQSFIIEDPTAHNLDGGEMIRPWTEFDWTKAPEHYKLACIKRGQHLGDSQVDYIRRIQVDHPKDRALIWRAYKISDSTYRRIIGRASETYSKLDYKSLLTPDHTKVTPEIKSWIENLIKPPKPPVTLAKIKNKIIEEFIISYSIYAIRKVLKADLKYTYRKGSIRVQKYST